MCIRTRRTPVFGCIAVLALAIACTDQAPPLDPDATHPLAAAGGANVVHVAPPTGDVAEDRASILAALEEVRPGGTVQFAPGTYMIGVNVPGSFAFIRVEVPQVTLLGHRDGTSLRGCDPAGGPFASGGCVGLQLVGGRQTVRDLAFEHFNQAVVPGFHLFIEDPEHQIGGYRIENNTFRNSIFAVRMFGQWTQPAVIRHNVFVNVGLGVQVWGRTAHVTDNDFSAPDWEQIPNWFEPFSAIDFGAWDALQTGPCDHNVAARNRTEFYPSGVFVGVVDPAGCRHIVIRDNTFVNSPEVAPFPAGPVWLDNVMEDPELLAHTLIQGNRIIGAQGVGVFAYYAVNTRVVGNSVEDITVSQFTPGWFGEANGSGVWISPESRHNQVLNNRFASVEAEEVILEGDHNHVATTSASDVVRDLGVGNRITGPGSVVTTAAPAGARAGVTPAAVERAGAARRLGERFGARGLLPGREAVREAAPR